MMTMSSSEKNPASARRCTQSASAMQNRIAARSTPRPEAGRAGGELPTPPLAPLASGGRGFFIVHLGERHAAVHHLARRGGDRAHAPVVRGADQVLHLHRLECEQW